MQSLHLLSFYIKWHYSQAFRDLFHNWRNFISFVSHLFSLKLLTRTWLSPFGRLNEDYKKGFNPEDFLETLVVNAVMRAVGFILRTFVILTGLVALALVFVSGPVIFVLWALSPLIILSLFVQGVIMLLN